ncbi:MAG TPA: hypothetical protein VNB06_10370, partial [Thermoanaerobaculia bacterium]|nr:hypothetical protein [Thermoanaerobaculia bacterium]
LAPLPPRRPGWGWRPPSSWPEYNRAHTHSRCCTSSKDRVTGRPEAAIVALACVVIPVRLRLPRRRLPDPGLPLAQSLRAELDRIRAQEGLLGSVAWWYLAPLGAGVILFMAGAPVAPLFKVGYAAVVVLFFGWLLRLNLEAVRRDLRPVAHELEGWLADLDEASIAEGGVDVP